jgi:formate dehydrogenase iron-sulfur subunit
LPLLARARRDLDGLASLSPRSRRGGEASTCGAGVSGRMPDRRPGPGEQYRFHFDMRKCIGCKCCVVACNEQNGNPASINWRRVVELEGGFFPNAARAFLSMGCNHCLDPTCLKGCPVNAYTKDLVTGIVLHSADTCIGCQYCTWNCAYGVPQYNAERGVVGKCDMCYGRLSLLQTPACVAACPEGAIAIEIVRTADWRAAVASARADTGVPIGDESLSTTRITASEKLPPDMRPRDITHVAPEHPHWSLIVMTVLTQLSVGAFVALWIVQLAGGVSGLGAAALWSMLAGVLALAAAVFHLGRPVHAYRALRMWRRSWLSREVLLFSTFSGAAALYAALLWFEAPASALAGGITAGLGIAGVTASACIYRVPSRPSWNTPYTLVQFHLTAGILGPLFAGLVAPGGARWLALAAAAMGGAQCVLVAFRFFRSIASDSPELRGTARLLATVLARRFVARGVLVTAGAVVLPLSGHALLPAFLLAAAGEILGRYLFFVSVVPRHLAAPYLASAREAA